MTRINLVPPQELSRQHLVAEYRELPRVFPLAIKAIARGERPTDRRNPIAYTLGTGHVRFFYSRLLFLRDRQLDLVEEMLRRGYHPTFHPRTLTALIIDLPGIWLNPYQPTPEALAINRARIKERL